MPGSFQCTLVTPQEQVIDEPVAYASIPAWDGLLGVAPSRAPLLVKLGSGPLRLDLTDGATRLIFLSGGFAQVKKNHLTLLTHEAVPADEIDRAGAKNDLQQALQSTATADDQVDQKQQRINRARAMLRVRDSAN